MTQDPTIQQYRNRNRRATIIGVALAVLLLAIIPVVVGMGAMHIPYNEVLSALWAQISQSPQAQETVAANKIAVVWEIRLPRILTSAFVGAGLAISGAIFQSILQNPLADPYTIGISSGAAFGACLAIFLNITFGLMLPTRLFALTSALITLITVIAITNHSGGMASSNLIIAGIIVSSILSAGISFLKMLSDDNVSAIVFWLMGSLSGSTWTDVAWLAPVVIAGTLFATMFSRDLDIMTLGPRAAASLGVNVAQTRLVYLIIGSIITAVCVSEAGVIGFVGLIVPHLLRISITSHNRYLVPLSAFLGAVLLLIADSLTRLAFAGVVPVGVLTTLIGGPFFIYIFLHRQKSRGGLDE